MTPIQKFTLAIFLFVGALNYEHYEQRRSSWVALRVSLMFATLAAMIVWLIMSGLATAIQGLPTVAR